MQKRGSRSSNRQSGKETEELDSLNARLRSKRRGAESIRQAMEANLEAASRKKRSREVPASAGFKTRG